MAPLHQPPRVERIAGALYGASWVMVVSHQPLAISVGGDVILSLLDAAPQWGRALRDERVALPSHKDKRASEQADEEE